MDFVTLYGTELDRELGSADRTVLFTTARRQAAINAAQLEWVERTQVPARQIRVTLTDESGEYDLDQLSSDVVDLSAQDVSIEIVPTTGTTRYLSGDDLRVTTVTRLDQEAPGWRSVTPGTPTARYLRFDGGRWYLGFSPVPSIPAGETWTAIIGAVVIPATLTSDTDEPFTINGNALRVLRPYHRALVHFAAYDLEKFRKDEQRGATQLQLWEHYIERYLAHQKPKAGQAVRFVRLYRGPRSARGNPRA